MYKLRDNAGWRVSSTLLSSLIAVVINYIIMFALAPYITTHLGTEAYGFVSLAKTIANYGLVITGCLNSFSARYIAMEYHHNNINKANTYFSSVVIANIGLLGFTVLFEILFVSNLQVFIHIPRDLVRDVKILFLFDIFNNVFLALANSFTAAAYVKNRLDSVELIKALSYITEAIVLICLFKFFPAKVYFVGIALLLSTTVVGLLNLVMSRHLAPDLTIKKRYFSWKAVKDLVVSGLWNSLNSIGNLLNSGLDLWVSNLMLTSLSMGQLSIVKTVATIFSTLISMMSKPFQPYLLKSYSTSDTQRLKTIFTFEIKFTGFVTNMMFAGLLVYGKIYYHLWVPKQDSALLYGITVVTIICFLFEGMVQPLFYTYTLTLKNRIPCFVTIFSGLLNVFGMYILLKYTNLGLYAVVGTTTVLGFFTFCIFTPLYSARCLGFKWYTFFPTMIRVLISACLVSIVVKGFSRIIMPTSWISLIMVAIIAVLIGLPVHCICVLDKDDIIKVSNRLFKKVG